MRRLDTTTVGEYVIGCLTVAYVVLSLTVTGVVLWFLLTLIGYLSRH